MPDPIDPTRTVAAPQDLSASAASSADETAPHGAGKPRFGPPAAPGEVGTLGPYRVVKQLGAGGMGAVYLAIDTRLDRKLALKVMLPEFAADAAAKERFLREARAAAKITHDNVVTVFEADERQGVPYIAMQFLQGYPLDEYLKTKGAPVLAHVIRVARETALGLAAAHQLGLVHRDIKPANLWLEAPNGRVKVLDFGLAKPVGTETELTKSGAVVGTPAYMSPEQARGSKVDARTDLFSLGAVLYRLCTGRTPFAGPNVMAVLMALGSDDPTPVRELNPNVPEPLAQLIHQLLSKKPDQRPQTATEVAKRLRAILEQLLTPGAPAVAPGPPVPASGADLSSSQPVVVHVLPHQPPIVVPMQVTARPEDVFANLGVDDEDDEDEPTQAEPVEAAPEPVRAAKKGKGVLLAAGGAALLALVAGVIIIKIKNKDGTETEIKVPDGATVEVTKDGKPIAKIDPKGVIDPKGKPEPKAVANDWVPLTPPAPASDWSKLWEAQGAQDWKLQDGELFNANANRGWIGTKKEYTDFEIELEYKFGAKGNSGIFLRAWPEGEPTGGQFVEIQLIDDPAYKTGDRNRTGAIFNRVGPDPKPASKLNEWNTARVTVAGKRVTVTINGTKCADADVEFPRAKGVIGLQQLDSSAYFRNVRVRDLAAVAANPDRAAAEWVLTVGGSRLTLQSATAQLEVVAGKDLPAAPFTVTAIVFPAATGDKVADADLARLQGLAELRSLTLSGRNVTDAGLEHLAGSPLISLTLYTTAVTGSGFAHLRGLTALQKIEVVGPLTDLGLEHLKGLPNLTTISLNGTAATDVGLGYLAEIKTLTALSVKETKVTAAGVAKLQKALPKCKIEWDEPKK